MKIFLIIALSLLIVLIISATVDDVPDIGVPLVDDHAGILENREKLEQLVKETYGETGVFVVVYVDHMVDKDESTEKIVSLASLTSVPDDCIFIIYYDTKITYEYFFAPGKNVKLDTPTIKLAFEAAAEQYEEIGGEQTLYKTIDDLRILMRGEQVDE